MKHIDIRSMAKTLNEHAREHPIGDLQKIRKNLKGLSRQPGRNIFYPKTIFEDGCYHYGGRRELQFNIWLENNSQIRHGVGFFFSRNINLQDPLGTLRPKVQRFNRFMRRHRDLYRNMKMRMWYYPDRGGIEYIPLGPIPDELVSLGAIIFLGKHQPVNGANIETILADFDQLLPLYEHVEGGNLRFGSLRQADAQFVFRHGCSSRRSSTLAKHNRGNRKVALLQNKLQSHLCRQLIRRYGVENVGDEHLCCPGARADVVVRRKMGFWIYEIKTSDSPRACLREAIGQLLEYAYWPGGIQKKARRLVVVGKMPIDSSTKQYLNRLKQQFSLPIEYRHVLA